MERFLGQRGAESGTLVEKEPDQNGPADVPADRSASVVFKSSAAGFSE